MTQNARLVLCVVWLLTCVAGGAAAAEPRQGAPLPARPQLDESGLGPMEVERLFDSYVVLQAQDALKLSEAQFPRFLPRLRALQESRRRGLRERRQLVAELNRLLRAPRLDEGRTRTALDRVRELEARTSAQVRQAYEALDEVLDLGQQARFRVFEEQVERRKLDLLLRARRGAAGRQIQKQQR